MSKRRKDEKKVHISHEGDIVVTPQGHKVLSIGWYIRNAKAAMEERDYATAWYHLGSAIARSTDDVETWELRQLEKKAYRLLLNRKADRKKKDKDKRRKRREYA